MKSFKPSKSAMEAALDCISRRAFTYYELENRLKEKGYESSEVNKVLERLLGWGYLNDSELAYTYSQSRLRRYSRRRVQLDMQKRGLDSQLIEQALEATYSSVDEFQQCLTLAEGWFEQESKRWELRNVADSKNKPVLRELWIRQKVFRKLVQRGYTSDMIRSVLSHMGKL